MAFCSAGTSSSGLIRYGDRGEEVRELQAGLNASGFAVDGARLAEDGIFGVKTLAALEALHHTDPDATLLEVNTGAISRGYRDTPYPAVFLLREWRGMGGQIILTADAHSPETVVYGYGQAAELARAAGFRECVLLTGRGWKPCPL